MRGHSVALQWTTGYIEIATSSGFNNFQSMCMHKTRRHFQTIVYQGGWYLFLTKLARPTTITSHSASLQQNLTVPWITIHLFYNTRASKVCWEGFTSYFVVSKFEVFAAMNSVASSPVSFLFFFFMASANRRPWAFSGVSLPCFEGCVCLSLVLLEGVDLVLEQQCKYTLRFAILPQHILLHFLEQNFCNVLS